MATPLIIIGAGGHGRELLDIVRDINRQSTDNPQTERFDFLGFVDDGKPDIDRLNRVGAKFLGPVSTLTDLPKGCEFSIGVGSGSVRRKLDEVAITAGLEPATLIHSSATIGADVRIAAGAVICAQVSVTTNVSIGRHTHINRNSTVGHDSILAQYSTINPLSAISGNVMVGEDAMVGTNSAINQGLEIGKGAVIASGSAVTKSVENHSLVAGVPAIMKKRLR